MPLDQRRDRLRQSNFIYRRPDRAEISRRPAADKIAQRWVDLIKRHRPAAVSVLDLGCSIGMDAKRLAARMDRRRPRSPRHRPTALHSGAADGACRW